MPETTQIQTQTGVDAVTLTVVEKVAEVTETSAEELPPLYESINPDALANLFEQSAGPQNRTGMVVFEMAGCTVTVTSTGTVSVTGGTEPLTDLHLTHNSVSSAPGEEVASPQTD